MIVCTPRWLLELLLTCLEGVMSGIIDAEPFAMVLPQVKDNSTIQGVVTAIYELGTFRVLGWTS